MSVFRKACLENLSFVKIGQEWRVLDMQTAGHLLLYSAELFLEREMFQTYVVGEIKTRFMFSNFFSPKIVPFMR